MSETSLPFQSEIRVMNPQSLKSDPSFRSNLNRLINDVYMLHEIGNPKYPNAPKFTSRRIQEDDQLAHELGRNGLIAVLIDRNATRLPQDHQQEGSESSGSSQRDYGGLVAVASIKPWKGRFVEQYLKQLEKHRGTEVVKRPMSDDIEEPNSSPGLSSKKQSEIHEWEVATCASIDNPKYRGTGCVSRCVDALRQELVQTREHLGRSEGKSIIFRVTASPGIGNVEYWSRRGFITEGPPDRAPVGMWGSAEEFDLFTMSKIVA